MYVSLTLAGHHHMYRYGLDDQSSCAPTWEPKHSERVYVLKSTANVVIWAVIPVWILFRRDTLKITAPRACSFFAVFVVLGSDAPLINAVEASVERKNWQRDDHPGTMLSDYPGQGRVACKEAEKHKSGRAYQNTSAETIFRTLAIPPRRLLNNRHILMFIIAQSRA